GAAQKLDFEGGFVSPMMRAFRSVRLPQGVRGNGGLGFVGLGKIGNGMVTNLLKAGQRLVVYDPNAAARDAAEQLGASSVTSLAEVAKCPVVFSALPDDQVLRRVATELLPALKPGAIHVSCSTVSPNISRALAEEHLAGGVGFVAAPVFARPDGMRRGEATFPARSLRRYDSFAREDGAGCARLWRGCRGSQRGEAGRELPHRCGHPSPFGGQRPGGEL
ncbi:unnamed protein product, partial [Effrenium voratum]